VNVKYDVRHSWAKAAQSSRDCDFMISNIVYSNGVVVQYHLGVPSLFRCIDEGFRDGLAPIDACAKDVKEESFQPVRFGHVDVCRVSG
jgi:hypothetical protein